MPFIPHTESDVKAMLASIGVKSINQLFDEIPQSLRKGSFLDNIPEGMTEMALSRLMQERSTEDKVSLNFIGAGAYEHHIPAAVWDIVERGEWMTAYTPYQAEASQGTLQLLYEYQTMMARLMSMEVSNASLYDGASALAEAILMAIRCNPPKNECARILIPATVHPFYRQVIKSIIKTEAIEIIEIPYSSESGKINHNALLNLAKDPFTALIIPFPNFFGNLEDVDFLVDLAHENGALAIALTNPIASALLKPPGEWGKEGADIACGEGQPLGIPLASGGPYFGFFCCKKVLIRQLPGRLIGRTVDKNGKTGFALTLQAREQHIRRAKATSNICTNQGLLVTAATIYLSLLGADGLSRVAAKCHANTQLLRDKISELQGVKSLFKAEPFFHELVLQFDMPIERVIKAFVKQGIEPGFNLKPYYPELGEALLVCATETKTEEDLNTYVRVLKAIMQQEVSLC